MKRFNWLFFINALILPTIPLLFLFNQNSQYLYFPIVAVTGIVLVLLIAIYYIIIRFLYKSDGIAFLACLIYVILLFALDSIYDANAKMGDSPIYLFILAPLITYIITYVIYCMIKRSEFQNLSIFIFLFLVVMLVINIYPLSSNLKTSNDNNIKLKYKFDFNVDNQLESPNVYWFLCDGMLGFNAMEKYFNDSQEELILALTDREFIINLDSASN